MQNYEQLGAFYLGQQYDLAKDALRPDLLLYDSKDLTTHAVCVGMTGSGKTGLCLSLLEEAAIDGIPAIIVDPKGDLGNLLLTFPNLQPADFRPWVEESEAARNGLTSDEYAAQTAKLWRDGLASTGQDASRIARLRSAVDMAIYTPGSSAGLQLTVLRSFDAPSPAVMKDADALRERISASSSGLLALLGIDADPIRSREHILLSNIFHRAWNEGRSLDIASLIREIQQPPFDRIGIMELETFFPTNDRFGMSMQLNNLVASPSFASWMEGEPLNIKRLLYTPHGKPRLSIISIAHLSESERMFFVTILLNEVLSWTRSQPGTSSLRALFYMDEVFGYFPPTANPPSKMPMLTLLKQARAYGVGIVLATQNPVDLDYKGLSNAGTWFLGRLQTERDKARVLDGLEGASTTTGAEFDRKAIENILSSLGSRVFLMNNVHDDEPVVFKTRWALSYLRGPLTRSQIQVLMAPRKSASIETATAFAASAPVQSGFQPPTQSTTHSSFAVPTSVNEFSAQPAGAALSPQAQPKTERPVVPPEANEVFVPARRSGGRMVYRPSLLGQCRLHFVRSTYGGVDIWKTLNLLSPIQDDDNDDPWNNCEELAEELPDQEKTPDSRIEFSSLPSAFTSARNYKSWAKDLKDYMYRERVVTVWKCVDLKQYSEPDEAEDDFRIRLGQLAKERRDLEVEKLRKKCASKLSTVKGQLKRAEERVDREQSQYRSSQFQTAISFGQSILGAMMGRKLTSTTNVTRAGTAMRSAGRSMRERTDIGRAEENVEALQEKLEELEAEAQEEIDKIKESIRVDEMEFEQLEIRPRKTDLAVEKIALVWLPWRVDSSGIAEPAF